jgi:hypothetical protein
MILKIFLPKTLAKKIGVFAKTIASCFEKTASFSLKIGKNRRNLL